MIAIKYNYFHLFSDCLAVKGYKQTTLTDYNMNNYIFIPNELTDIIIKLNKSDIKTVKAKFNNEFDTEIDMFCENLIKKKIAFYSHTRLNFPSLNKVWAAPYKITNTLIELDSKINYETLPCLVTDCLGIIIKEYCHNTIKVINLITEKVKNNTFQIFIYCKTDEVNLKLISNTFTKLSHIHILNTNKNNIKNINGVVIVYSKNNNTINKDDFIINIPLFTESQKHNTYFNRKLYIGTNGEIKNVPLAPDIFGNINALEKTEEILTIIDSSEFQKYWYIHKGLIDVCKQCEFRHMCVDNRVPIKRTEKEWYFETECNYNPYIAKWQDEDGYKTLAECGIQSNASGFKINRKKLNAINKVLWGDD